MDDNQIRAIKMKSHLGLRLQREHPEMAKLYRKEDCSEIADRLDVARFYGVPEEWGKYIVYNALVGHKDSFGNSYDGLIQPRLAKKLGKRHKSRNGKNVADFRPEYGPIDERRKRDGIGLYAQTTAQRRIAGATGATAAGRPEWGADELKKLYLFSQSEYFKHQNGSIKGLPNYVLVTRVLNKRYHRRGPKRTTWGVKKRLYRLLKEINTTEQS